MKFSKVRFIMWVARVIGVPIDVRAQYFMREQKSYSGMSPNAVNRCADDMRAAIKGSTR